MSEPFFAEVIEPIRFAGPDAQDPLAFRWYDADRVIDGRPLAEHLRPAVAYWHSFNWSGSDPFGAPTLERPWLETTADPMAAAARKLEVAFEFLEKLSVPFFCFHDRDLAPEGATVVESKANLDRIADLAAAEMERTGVQLLWGTANLFSHPRYMAGAATNPDPDVFAMAAAQVCHCLEVTNRLGGANFVFWGGREGYDTLLNTDLRRELDQLARFLHLVVEHKHRIDFRGELLLEPKPCEPTKHQYDFDAAAVHAFLLQHDLVGEIRLNLEVNHATLAGHDFQHEVAYAVAHDLLGSLDANAGDDRLGWDVDRFPVSVEQIALGLYEVLRGGGLSSGGCNFDAHVRRQSIDPIDLFYAHIGGLDVLARGFLVAHALLTEGELESARAKRYAAWDCAHGKAVLAGERSLVDLTEHARAMPTPTPRSGRQEQLENLVARTLDRVR